MQEVNSLVPAFEKLRHAFRDPLYFLVLIGVFGMGLHPVEEIVPMQKQDLELLIPVVQIILG